MKVFVVFDFPEIEDANSEEATFAIDSLSDDLEIMSNTTLYQWYIDDAEGDKMVNKTIDDAIFIIHALKMALNRLQWFSVTGDMILLKECVEWISIAENYKDKLILEQKYESC